jgi:prepilin-type N-terminal cleavage/methylation domain-containing protein
MSETQRGFTLIEILIGTTLVLLVTAGMAASTIGSLQTTTVSNHATVASSLVHDKIEQLRSLDPSTNPPDLVPGEHDEEAGTIDQLGNAGGAFTRAWVVTANTPILGVSQVVVSVGWSDPSPRTVVGVTYVCEEPSCA